MKYETGRSDITTATKWSGCDFDYPLQTTEIISRWRKGWLWENMINLVSISSERTQIE